MVHAGGVCISGIDFFGDLPCEKSTSKSAVLQVTQFDMGDIAKLHILKIDLLGLKTLTKEKITMDLAGLDWDWYDSQDYDDPKVYEFIRQAHTKEVFQMEKPEPTRMLHDFYVTDLLGITSVNAGNRPGGIAKIDKLGNMSMVDIYQQGAKETKEGNPISFSWGIKEVDDYLNETYRAILYQEQCMELGRILAGYSDGDTDKRIRKVLAKKLMKLIPEIEVEFIYGTLPCKTIYTDQNGNKEEVIVFYKGADEIVGPVSEYENNYHRGYRPKPDFNTKSPYCVGAINRGFDEQALIKLFDVFIAFGSYGFNKSHAGAYAVTAYKTAWLSLYYPEEYCCACISQMKDTEDITDCINSFKKRGVVVYPPRVNLSGTNIGISYDQNGKKSLSYGLSQIKEVGEIVTELIVAERKANGPYKSLEDFIDRLNENKTKTVLSMLTPKSNGNYTSPVNKKAINALIKAGAFDDLEPNRYKLLNLYNAQIKGDKDWNMLDESEFVKARKYKLALEKETMGYYVSEHPLDTFPYVDFSMLADGQPIRFTGLVLSKTSKKSGKGNNYTQVKVNCKDGLVGEKDVICNFFNRGNKKNEYAKFAKEGSIIVLCGTWSKQWNNVSVNRVELLQGVSDCDLDNLEQAGLPNHNPTGFTLDMNSIFGG